MNEKYKLLLPFITDSINNSSNYLVSIYIPILHKTNLEIQSLLKSQIFEIVNSNFLKEKNVNISAENLFNMISSALVTTDYVGEVLGIFFEVDPSATNKNIKNIKTISLSSDHITESQFFISESYKIEPLINYVNNDCSLLALHISKEKALVYEIINNKIILKDEIENETRDFNQTIGDDTFSPFSSREKYFSGGEYSEQRKQEDENNDLVLKTIDYLKENTKENKPEFVLIFHSSAIGHEYLTIKFLNIFNNPNSSEFIFIDKNVTDIETIKEDCVKACKERQKEILMSKIQNYKNQFPKFVTGWNEVCKASMVRNIETLFIKPSVSHPGYVFDDKFPVIEKTENTREVKNILPWIINIVLESSGEAYIVDNDMLEHDISAKLRY